MNAKRINLNQFNKLLLAVFLLSLILYLGKPFLIPVAVAAFFAMLLYPFVLKLQRIGFKKSMAALSSILLVLLVLAGLSTVVYTKLANLKTDLPEIEQKIKHKTNRLQGLLSETTDISEFEQEVILEQKKPDFLKEVGKTLKNFLVQGLYLLLQIFIVLTYTFFFLVYRHRIQNFFIKVNWFHNHEESRRVFLRINQVVHDYLQGTFMVISVLAVIYTLGFWAIGLKHALLFALITALLRIVPYFGSFLGIAFPIAFSLLIQDALWQPVLILLFFMVTQLLEANFLTPYITGSRVKLNPLFTIMAILLGSLIWGVSGMVLFVPFFGILRIIFDEITQLQPYAYILGNEEEETP
ncbi:AI-2E family transporter [Adhaeribacter radiodurans]|uniref:AI-2E family transporter n=1 Tax=Adhaeribacter radiodurans TaxID=2745197 RepID=A0A7L7L5G2_9BACT|nr:AI-2E family transporter [Adhaeribacter radiodurans]QMU28036.1 AI-2E family transporter [Adhaeribacter radiodurans]